MSLKELLKSATPVSETVSYVEQSGCGIFICKPIGKGQRELSSTGKSLKVATTSGNKPVSLNGEVISAGINLFVKHNAPATINA